jgi:CRISPR-associated protein TM1802 (cas_TM1802)
MAGFYELFFSLQGHRNCRAEIHFFDNNNITRSFPLCDDCYQRLQNGITFVGNRLNYNVSSASKLIQIKGQKKKKKKSTPGNIEFWLIPFVNNLEIVERFKHNLASHNKQLPPKRLK